MDNSNVNGVAKMIQPPRNRRLPTDVRSADRASVIHPVRWSLYLTAPASPGAFFCAGPPFSRTGSAKSTSRRRWKAPAALEHDRG